MYCKSMELWLNGTTLSLIKDVKQLIKKEDKMTIFRKGYQLIPFDDIEDQWIPESEWTRDKIGDTQPRVVALDATFPWWVSPSKN